ncbi:MAG: hypothetical protein WDO12_11270 [Pseudomonadota bacterium]
MIGTIATKPVRFMLLGALLMAAAAGCTKAPTVTKLPDFSGWWVWERPTDGELPMPFMNAPFKDEIAGPLNGMKAAFRQAKMPDLADLGIDQRRTYCTPPRFAGFSGGFEDSVEYLFTPGRVTITNEGGLIRRVALDAPLPTDVEVSNAGTSVGHWEGQTLVIETIGTHPAASIGPFTPGPGARYVEHISLREPEVMQVVVRITAPAFLKEPYESTLVYRRDRNHVFHDGSLSSDSCLENDPSIDPKTGRQRLDMTPPSDLPPPPKD